MAIYSKPSVPQPEWGHYLWTKCLFAAAHGWQRGHDAITDETTRDDVNKLRGAIDGSVPGTIVFDLPGWSAAAGNSLDIQKWPDSAFYDFATDGMSMFTLYRMLADNGQNAFVFGRGTGISGSDQGWGIRNVQGASDYRFRVCNPPAQSTVDFGFYSEPGVWQRLAATVSLGLDVVCYQDAIVQATSTFVDQPSSANPNDTVKIFGDDTGPNDQLDGQMSMSAFWNVELSQKMMADLEVDPFVMWKPQHVNVHLGDLIAFAQAYQTYMGAF